MAIAPVRLKINTASEIERELQEERVMEEEESDKTRESGTESVKGGVGGTARIERFRINWGLRSTFCLSKCMDGSSVPDKLVLSHRRSLIPHPST